MMEGVGKIIIIGSGPAGWAAAVYNARAQLKPLMFAGEENGGQLMKTTVVENYVGFEEGIVGPELMMKMRAQAEKFGTEIVDRNVTEVDFSQRPFVVAVGDEQYRSEAVIIATGAESKMLGVSGEDKFLGRGVATCAVCDAPFYKEKVTFVAGGGDAAAEDALALTKHAKSVTMLVRGEQLGASKIMAERVSAHEKVKIKFNSLVKEVRGNSVVEEIVVENAKTGEEETLAADGLFIAIGHRPMTDVFRGKVDLDEKGYLVTCLNSLKESIPEENWLKGYPTMTSVEGVFGAGDVVDFRYRQAITAAGFGCMAALDAEKWLENQADQKREIAIRQGYENI